MSAVKYEMPRRKPVVVTRKFEEILKAVNFYRYMTALDVAHLLYSPAGIVRVRSGLTKLGDFVDGEYLYRLRLPDVPRGNPERIYTLGVKWRDYLVNVSGVSVGWYFRPEKQKHFSFGMLMHDLILTRFLVAAHRFALERPDFRVSSVRVCYELAGSPVEVELDVKGKREKISVVPDGWVLFEKLRDGRHMHWFPVLVEIDRSTMYRERFKRHIRSLWRLLRAGSTRGFLGYGLLLSLTRRPEPQGN